MAVMADKVKREKRAFKCTTICARIRLKTLIKAIFRSLVKQGFKMEADNTVLTWCQGQGYVIENIKI
jgi:uncharacterized glyoxalase superfamily protein PhnB